MLTYLILWRCLAIASVVSYFVVTINRYIFRSFSHLCFFSCESLKNSTWLKMYSNKTHREKNHCGWPSHNLKQWFPVWGFAREIWGVRCKQIGGAEEIHFWFTKLCLLFFLSVIPLKNYCLYVSQQSNQIFLYQQGGQNLPLLKTLKIRQNDSLLVKVCNNLHVTHSLIPISPAGA